MRWSSSPWAASWRCGVRVRLGRSGATSSTCNGARHEWRVDLKSRSIKTPPVFAPWRLGSRGVSSGTNQRSPWGGVRITEPAWRRVRGHQRTGRTDWEGPRSKVLTRSKPREMGPYDGEWREKGVRITIEGTNPTPRSMPRFAWRGGGVEISGSRKSGSWGRGIEDLDSKYKT